MIYQRHVTRQGARTRRSSLVDLLDGAVDFVAGELPVIVEIGDDRFHERLAKPGRTFLVAEVVDEDRKRELLRARALVCPFETIPRELFDLVMLVEALAIHGDDEAVDGASSLVGLHWLRH